MRGTGTGVPRSTTPGNATSAPGSSGTAGLGVSGLLLQSSLGFLPPPINWRRVQDNVEFTCL
jgi:hypothetical protein